MADSETNYYRTLAEYAVAVKNVHFTKGTLLDYDGVYLAEGAWPAKAYSDAAALERRRGRPRPMSYASSLAPVVTRGAYDQHPGDAGYPTVEPIEAPEELELDPDLPVEEVTPPEPEEPTSVFGPVAELKLMGPLSITDELQSDELPAPPMGDERVAAEPAEGNPFR